MTMLSPSLSVLILSDIPSLVELPSSIQNLSKLAVLIIKDCINLETLPTGINFQDLLEFNLSGCSRLKSFPEISTNIARLDLSRTGIEEVPWWIQYFSRLEYLEMESCNSLRRVSLNIYKLKHLTSVDFSDCKALTAASWDYNPNLVAMATDNIHSNFPVHDPDSSSLDFVPNFGISFKFFNLDPEAFLHQPTIIFEQLFLSGEEVPSYFTHRPTTETPLLVNIPLLHYPLSQPFFSFKACALVVFDSVPLRGDNVVYIRVYCRLRGEFVDDVYFSGKQQVFETKKKDSHLFIMDCSVPLRLDNTQVLNYGHMDIQLRISNRTNSTFELNLSKKGIQNQYLSNSSPSKFKLSGWGIRLSEEFATPGDW